MFCRGHVSEIFDLQLSTGRVKRSVCRKPFFLLLKVKKYKKTSRATSALDTSVELECVLI